MARLRNEPDSPGAEFRIAVAGPAASFIFGVFAFAGWFIAMTGNFFLNNLFTYRDRRLHGRRLWTGLVSFYAVCGAGGAANIGVAAHLAVGQHSWWVAGLAGAAVSVVWNYAMSSVFTWSARSMPAPRPRMQPADQTEPLPEPVAAALQPH